jgi:hypothetical protein
MYWSSAVNGEGLIIEMGGEDFEVTRFNTHLYTFLGHLATRNHVFITTQEDDDGAQGVYLWQTFHKEAYDRLHAHIQEHRYAQFLNLYEISESDEQAYESAIRRQVANIGDFIPEDFDE